MSFCGWICQEQCCPEQCCPEARAASVREAQCSAHELPGAAKFETFKVACVTPTFNEFKECDRTLWVRDAEQSITCGKRLAFIVVVTGRAFRVSEDRARRTGEYINPLLLCDMRDLSFA